MGFFRGSAAKSVEYTTSGSAETEFFAHKLNSVRSCQRGNCMACAAKVGAVLTSSQALPIADPVSENNNEYNEEKLFGKKDQVFLVGDADGFNEEGALGLLTYFKQQKPGIYALSKEDHTFNMFKTAEGKLYLLDSDVRFYSEITDMKDFETPKGTVSKDQDYNYLFNSSELEDSEEVTINVYFQGQAHPSWEERLKLLETKSESASPESATEDPRPPSA